MDKMKDYRSFCKEQGIGQNLPVDRQIINYNVHQSTGDAYSASSTEHEASVPSDGKIDETSALSRLSGNTSPEQKICELIASTRPSIDDATIKEIEKQDGQNDDFEDYGAVTDDDEVTIPYGHQGMVKTKPHGIEPGN
jgi:hypothetical protein